MDLVGSKQQTPECRIASRQCDDLTIGRSRIEGPLPESARAEGRVDQATR
jgi:hypothetical protein